MSEIRKSSVVLFVSVLAAAPIERADGLTNSPSAFRMLAIRREAFSAFSVFSVLYLGEKIKWNYAAGFGCIALAVFFVFHKW